MFGVGGVFAFFAAASIWSVFAWREVANQSSGNVSREVRGVRNNNPGNLVLTDIPWNGKVPREQNTDGRFEQFTHPQWGIRALFIDISGDVREGQDTVERLISEFAPSSENNTAAYIQAVSREVGKPSDAPILGEDFLPIVRAIIRHENGKNPYSDEFIEEAIALA